MFSPLDVNSTIESKKSVQDDESAIDEEVRDLVRDLGGKIAAQSFGFDKVTLS
jgi:hypothetical protein